MVLNGFSWLCDRSYERVGRAEFFTTSRTSCINKRHDILYLWLVIYESFIESYSF
jgi:hypothetical protein